MATHKSPELKDRRQARRTTVLCFKWQPTNPPNSKTDVKRDAQRSCVSNGNPQIPRTQRPTSSATHNGLVFQMATHKSPELKDRRQARRTTVLCFKWQPTNPPNSKTDVKRDAQRSCVSNGNPQIPRTQRPTSSATHNGYIPKQTNLLIWDRKKKKGQLSFQNGTLTQTHAG
jgi:hypothetical protein